MVPVHHISMPGIVQHLTLRQAGFHGGDIHRPLAQLDRKALSYGRQLTLQGAPFPCSRCETALRVSNNAHLERLFMRPSRPVNERLLRTDKAADVEATAQEGRAVIQQFPGHLHQGIIEIEQESRWRCWR